VRTLYAEPETNKSRVVKPYLRVWEGGAFARSVPRLEYCWGKSVAYGATTAITGVRGRGKTYLLLGATEAIVKDYPSYLGRPITRRTGRVLLLLSDDAAEPISARIESLKLAVPDRLFVASAGDWGGDPLAVLGLLTDHARAIGGVDLIGIDAKYVFIPNEAGAGNDAGLTNRMMEVLRTVATETKAGVWLNDHDNRAGGMMSGSAVGQNAMLAIFHLRSAGEGEAVESPDAILSCEKQKALARAAWPPTVRITQSQSSTWTVVGNEADLTAREINDDLEPIVLGILDAATKPLTVEAVAKKSKRRLTDVREMLGSLWSRDKATRTGTSAKGDPMKYAKREAA
jgi:hypothetical protein